MFKSKNLLAVSADAKTIKGTDKGVLTGILYLAPHTLSGQNVCPKASKQCAAACLFTAGRGIYTSVQQGRLNKTKWFFDERHTFMEKLVSDIAKLERKAKKLGMTPAVRLNGTSDITWEKIPVMYKGHAYGNVMEAFPNIAFYDYTKIIGRKRALALPNYHLTFSLSEDNDADAVKAIKQGYNVAVVISIGRTAEKPSSWGGYPAIDGDETDIRFRDPKGGHIVLLRAKGPAGKLAESDDSFVRKHSSGFREIAVQNAA